MLSPDMPPTTELSLQFDDVEQPSFALNSRFGVGLHWLWSDDLELLQDIAKTAVGIKAPRRGHVALSQRNPYREPEVRRRIGSFLGDVTFDPKQLPLGKARGARISGVLNQLDVLRGGRVGASVATYSRLGLSYDDRLLSELDHSARRQLELALALSDSARELIVLFQPWCAGVDSSSLLAALERRAEDTVVLLGTNAAPPAQLAAHKWLFHERRLYDRTPPERPARPGARARLTLSTTPSQNLAARLRACEDVLGVELESESPDRSVWLLEGLSRDALSRVALLACRELNLQVFALSTSAATVGHALSLVPSLTSSLTPPQQSRDVHEAKASL